MKVLHAQKVIQKRMTVDAGIVPLIKWLNNLTGVITSFSCQGEGNKVSPYVVFNCFSSLSLWAITRYVVSYAQEFKTMDDPLMDLTHRHVVYFNKPEDLQKCISNLPKIKKDVFGNGYVEEP